REIVDRAKVSAREAVAKAASDPVKLAKAQSALKDAEALTQANALMSFRAALESGLLKIMSKMGISVLGSYHGAQIFEVIGVGPKVVEQCFWRTPSQVGGI